MGFVKGGEMGVGMGFGAGGQGGGQEAELWRSPSYR